MPKTGTYTIGTTDFYGEFYEPLIASAVRKSPSEIEPTDVLKVHTGMKLLVRWPDGKFTRETIEVHEYGDEAQVDMNNYPDHFTARRLNVVRTIHGQKALIPLKKGQKVRLARHV